MKFADPNDDLCKGRPPTFRGQLAQNTLLFVVLPTALFLCTLDTTIVATCLPGIGSDFHEYNVASWVGTAYMLTLDAFQPILGKLSDIFGRKPVLMVGVVVFLVGSLLCGVAQSMIMLILSRALAGMGAAAIFSSVYIIISEMVPLKDRANYQGVLSIAYGSAAIIGPLVGGGFTDHVTWRWAFLINLPIGGVVLLLLFIFLDLPTQSTSFIAKLKRIDYAGTFLILSASVLFLLALNFGSGGYTWVSVVVLVPLVLSFVLLVVFGVVECRYAQEPILDPRFFRNRSVVGTVLVNLFLGINTFAVFYYVPVYLQVVKGDSALLSGVRLIPLQIGANVFVIISGFLITKTQTYRPCLWIGTALTTVNMGLLCLLDVDTGFPGMYGMFAFIGFTNGLLFTSTLISIQSAVEPEDIAVVTGLQHFSRLLGGAIGIATGSSILNSALAVKLPHVLPPDYVALVIESSYFIHNGLPGQHLAATLQAYAESLRLIWYVMIPLAGLGVISSLLIKHHDLQRHESPTQDNSSTISNTA